MGIAEKGLIMQNVNICCS